MRQQKLKHSLAAETADVSGNSMRQKPPAWSVDDRPKIFVFVMALIGIVWVGGLYGCAVRQPVCIVDDQQYCRTRGNFTGQWYDYYLRALSCIEGKCYEAAVSDLDTAIAMRKHDQRRARMFGMHFLDYFPHREKGLVYFLQGQYGLAKKELEISLSQYPSAKATFYLNEIRKVLLEKENQPVSSPRIRILNPEYIQETGYIRTNADPVIIHGVVEDDQFVSAITFSDQQVFVAQSSQRITFNQQLTLSQGVHEFDIVAKNIRGGQNHKLLKVWVDRSGPEISITDVKAGKYIRGFLYDESGGMTLVINGTSIPIGPGREEAFFHPLSSQDAYIDIQATDQLGNQTRTRLLDNLSSQRVSPYLAMNSAVDGDIDTWTMARNAENSLTDTLPRLVIRDLSESEIVYNQRIQLHIEAMGKGPIDQILVNGNNVLKRSGRIISTSYWYDLELGHQVIRISAQDANGNRVEHQIEIERRIPEALRIDKRYAIAIHPLDTFPLTESGSDPAVFIHRFIDHLMKRKRFQLRPGENLATQLNQVALPLNLSVAPISLDGILLGLFHKTENGVEIAVRLVAVHSGETMAMADVYGTSDHPEGLNRLGNVLAEKLIRQVPIVDAQIRQINASGYVCEPQTWIPEPHKLPLGWPMLVYRNIPAQDAIRGTDKVVLKTVHIGRIPDTGTIILLPNDDDLNIRTSDRVICR